MKTRKIEFAIWFYCVCCLLILPITANAHPGWGLVADKVGNLYFTDLFHNRGTLWRLDDQGELRAIMTKVHSHSLSAGPEASLWLGDSQWIDGVIEGDGENTLYRIDRHGAIRELIRTRAGSEFYGNTIAVDREGSVFFMREQHLYRWRAGEKAILVSKQAFGRIITAYAGRDGCIYVVDNKLEGGSLIRVDPTDGQTETVVNQLLEKQPLNPPFDNPMHNMLYAISQDEAGNFFVCNSGSRWVWQISVTGEKKVIFRSEAPWYPVGITFRNGVAIVMECGYIEGEGHQGPRLLEWKPGAKKGELLIEVGKESRPECEWCGAMDAPPNPGWQTNIPPLDEPGEPLIMEGRVLKEDGKTPAANVVLYAYHTNNKGGYPKWGDETGNAVRHGYLRGWMKTDTQGRYRFTTIRPKPYPGRNEPAHIHFTLTPPDKEEYWIDALWFKGDPLITSKLLKGIKRPGGDSNIVELKKDKEGIWRGIRDIVLKEY